MPSSSALRAARKPLSAIKMGVCVAGAVIHPSLMFRACAHKTTPRNTP